MFGFRKRRRARLRRQPLPDASWSIIDRRVPYARMLPDDHRAELAGIIQILLHEKRFEGCGGLEMTDEIRLVIAAQAAILLLCRDTDYYPGLRSILVYPDAYVAHAEEELPDGTVIAGVETRLGESWTDGALVLSWSDVLHGARNPVDGQNVVFHEFAHQLDDEWGAMEGAPALQSQDQLDSWARVLSREYDELINHVERGRHTLIDDYGTTNPAEFFAVVTELFFEQPEVMRREHPDLYQEFARYYQQDPAAVRQAYRERAQEDERSRDG